MPRSKARALERDLRLPPAVLACLIVPILLSACASRPIPANPAIPADTQYSTAGTLSAAGGVVGMAAGAQMTRSGSGQTRAVGAGLAAAGAGLMIPALIDALQVQQARDKFFKLNNAFWRRYVGSPAPEDGASAPWPSTPELPFRFPDDSVEREDSKHD